MRILAIETATDACSVALADRADVAERHVIAPRKHAELILPMLDTVLTEAGYRLADLDGLAFGRGPGSFTGVRIAASVIQGIALATALPVAPISTLAALARGACRASGAARVIAALDARMGEIYCGAFRFASDTMDVTLDDALGRPPDVTLPPTGDWYGAGSGWGVCGAVLAARLGKRLTGINAACVPRARDVAALAQAMLAAGAGVDAARALPTYLRDRVTY